MLGQALSVTTSLDVSTLLVVLVSVTGLLGFVLLFAWMQDRIRALAWWGAAYLLGGLSVASWSVEHLVAPPLPFGFTTALLFVACGMMWSAARLFHGRRVPWIGMCAGALIWTAACFYPDFATATAARITLSSIIVASYTMLTAAELWRERRRALIRRWPALFVPILHGLVFMFPIPLAGMMPAEAGMATIAGTWVAVFVLEVMLYVVATAFIVLILSKDRAVRIHKTAAETDALTGLLNRRGFVQASELLLAQAARRKENVAVLMCDLDHFKTINDTYGHALGDMVLRQFAATMNATLRASDIVGRIGGEEFALILRGDALDAGAAAERLRSAFEQAGRAIGGVAIDATVSIGIGCGQPGQGLFAIMVQADRALYQAKRRGRNRVAVAVPEAETLPTLISTAPVQGATVTALGAASASRPAAAA